MALRQQPGVMWPAAAWFELGLGEELEPVGMWDASLFQNPALLVWLQRFPVDELQYMATSLLLGDGTPLNPGVLAEAFDVNSGVLSLSFISTEVEGDFYFGGTWQRYYSVLRWFQFRCGLPAQFEVYADAYWQFADEDWSTPRSPSFVFAICSTFAPDVLQLHVAVPDDARTDWLFWSWYFDFVTSFEFDVIFDYQYPCRYQLDLVYGWE
jgi:hypothetical protein